MMEQERPLDRRNRRWGSLRNSVCLRVRLSQQAKAILSTLRDSEEEQISYGAVIEKLVEKHASLLRRREKSRKKAKQAANSWVLAEHKTNSRDESELKIDQKLSQTNENEASKRSLGALKLHREKT
jgi:hypothetical protein